MIKPILATVAAVAACALTACAPARSQSESTADTVLLQSRLAASEENVAQLSQQVALLQMMVDSHQRTLQNSEITDAVPAEAPDAPAVSPQPTAVEEIQTVEIPSQPDSPPEISPQPERLQSSQEETSLPPQTPETASLVELSIPGYQQAMDVFRSGDYESAAPLFEAFANKFPQDDLADNALYWAGECKYARKEFPEAIQRFKRVVSEYPDGSKVPDALLKTGFAYISMGDRESATTYLKQVVAQYPFSDAGAKAEARLRAIQKQ